MKLDDQITERATKDPFAGLSEGNFGKNKSGLDKILASIKKAKTDEKIKGIFLDLSAIPTGIATIEEIRNALIDFKKSKKFIISFGDGYTQGAYYVGSVADKVYLHPEGMIEWKGLSAQIMFFKGLLEKLEVDAQIFRHGKFKSAIEPFDLTKMSEANRLQTRTYVGSLWNHMVTGISAMRKISKEELNRYADEMLITDAKDAVSMKLADKLMYRDEVIAELKKLSAIQDKKDLRLVNVEKYAETGEDADLNSRLSKNKVAIVYAVGGIESGEGDDETIGSDRISKAIREARTDSTVKAIVLRINSPGGSALASDVIWREVVLCRQQKKPIVVSMGDVAASGGYYIACPADRIFAQPNTITGSIGVFGVLPNLQKFYNNKLGITIDTVNSNKHSDIGSLNRPVTPEEEKVILDGVKKIYSAFIAKVSEGRNIPVSQVDSLGQGRVWSGVHAKEKKLVDELGGIDDAIAYAVKMAKLKEYRVVHTPTLKDPFSEIFKNASEEEEARLLKGALGEHYLTYRRMKFILGLKGVQARMEYEIIVN